MPLKLLRNDVHDRRAVFGWEIVDSHGPSWEGECHQDDRLDDGNGNLQITRRVALDTCVVSFRVG